MWLTDKTNLKEIETKIELAKWLERAWISEHYNQVYDEESGDYTTEYEISRWVDEQKTKDMEEILKDIISKLLK